MSNIIIRRNKKFCINESIFPKEANKTDIRNALLAAIYDEFKGASVNPNYCKLTPLEKINKVNEFAENWLKERGLL